VLVSVLHAGKDEDRRECHCPLVLGFEQKVVAAVEYALAKGLHYAASTIRFA
jgi:hypothetical protein